MKRYLFVSIIVILVASGFIVIGCVSGQSTTYYVSKSGNDKNNGKTINESFASVNLAVNIAQPGDSVIVLPGYYSERIKILNSGDANRRIYVFSEKKNEAQIDGGFEIKGNNICISGFSITNKNQSWPDRIAILIEGSNVEIADNYLYEVRNEAIRGSLKHMPSDVLIENNKIYHSQMGIVVEGNGWMVRNNEVERLYDYGNGDCDYSRFFGNNHKFISNKFHGTIQAEIGKSHVDCFQTFDNNGQSAQNILIEKNFCQNFMQGFMGEAHFHHKISDILFRNNIFTDGFQTNSHGMIIQDIPNVRVINNNFINIKWRGVTIQPADHGLAKYAIIKNNIFYNCGTSYSYFDNTSKGDYNMIFMTKNNPNKGANDIIGKDPLFTDFLRGNYRLQSESPAIDAGEILDMVRDDFFNNKRPVNASHDIGATEYTDDQ